MRLAKAPVSMYKKYFKILLCVFLAVFALEFIASIMGSPIISHYYVDGVEVVPQTVEGCALNALIPAFMLSGVVNTFLTANVIKERLRLTQWPIAVFPLFFVFSALLVLIGILLVVPNIIIFGIKGRKQSVIYKFD